MDLQYLGDTTFLVALFAARDSHHEAAVEALRRVADESRGARPLVVTDYIFDELVTTLRVRARSHPIATKAGKTVLQSPLVRLVPVGARTFEAGWELFLARPDKEWSFTDCVSFRVMEELGLRQALTFDPNFKEAGFSMVPGA